MGYVVGMVRAHLDYCDLSFGTNLEQRQRHADIIVQIALGRRNDKFLGKNAADKLLCGCLSVGTGKTDDSQSLSVDKSMLPMPAGKSLESHQSVRYGNDPWISGSGSLRALVDDSIGSSGLQCLERIRITVEILALEGKEHLSALDCAAVGSHDSAAGYVFSVKFFHHYLTPVLPKPPSPRSVSSSTSTSSHSTCSCLAITIWAILSPGSMTKSSLERLTSITLISPL